MTNENQHQPEPDFDEDEDLEVADPGAIQIDDAAALGIIMTTFAQLRVEVRQRIVRALGALYGYREPSSLDKVLEVLQPVLPELMNAVATQVASAAAPQPASLRTVITVRPDRATGDLVLLDDISREIARIPHAMLREHMATHAPGGSEAG